MSFDYRALTFCGRTFQFVSTHSRCVVRDNAPHLPYNPAPSKGNGLGSSAFARRY